MAFMPSFLVEVARTGHRTFDAIASAPAQQLASFMDEFDEVWQVDAFTDRPGTIDPTN